MNGAEEKNILIKQITESIFTYLDILRKQEYSPKNPTQVISQCQAIELVRGSHIPMGGIRAMATIGTNINLFFTYSPQ
jgi:hypothetical protein